MLNKNVSYILRRYTVIDMVRKGADRWQIKKRIDKIHDEQIETAFVKTCTRLGITAPAVLGEYTKIGDGEILLAIIAFLQAHPELVELLVTIIQSLLVA